VRHIPCFNRHENNPFAFITGKGEFTEVLLANLACFDIGGEVSGEDCLIHDISF
jgi:multisubunit Na+/H+ antiporter MnhB subunit